MSENGNKLQFQNWLLKSGVKESSVIRMLSYFDKISDYAIDEKRFDYTIWEIKKVKQYKEFVNELQSFKFFRVMHKDLFKFLQNNAMAYMKFLKECVCSHVILKYVDPSEYIVTEKDKELNDSYPEELKQVYLTLKENDKQVYLTINQIMKASSSSEENVNNILIVASWSEKLGDGYVLGKNNSISETKKVTLCLENAYKSTSDIECVLISTFKRGYRHNIMDRKRFESIFEEMHRKVLTVDDYSRFISQKCFFFDERYFLPKAVVEKHVAENMIKYIEEYFEKHDILFYDVLFEKFKESFNSYIYSAEMLVEYMKKTFEGTPLYFENRYFSYRMGMKPNINLEVESYLINADRPCSYDDIYNNLSHLSRDDVYSVLHYNNSEIMGNSKTEYFHLEVAHISEWDKKVFTDICTALLRNSKYITCNEIITNLGQVDSNLLENLEAKFSMLGIRRILTYYLRNEYDVMTGVITRKGEKMTIGEVFADYARSHNYFTTANVQDLADYTGTVPYWESIQQNSIRINRDEFVSDIALDFDIEAIDNAIAFYCDEYLPLCEIVEFMRFPACGYPWNTYLLQQYVFRFSELFRLEFLGFAKSSANGVIVRRQLVYSDFDSILIDVLVRTNIKTKDDALDYLCKRGFVTDRRYKKVEELLKKAITRRNINNEM